MLGSVTVITSDDLDKLAQNVGRNIQAARAELPRIAERINQAFDGFQFWGGIAENDSNAGAKQQWADGTVRACHDLLTVFGTDEGRARSFEESEAFLAAMAHLEPAFPREGDTAACSALASHLRRALPPGATLSGEDDGLPPNLKTAFFEAVPRMLAAVRSTLFLAKRAENE